MDIASLGIRIDSTSVTPAVNGLDKLTESGVKAEQSTKRVTTASEMLTSALQKAAAAIGLYKMADLARDSAMMAARYETLGVVMYNVGKNAGYTRAEMDAASGSLQRYGIAMIESRSVLTRLVQAHIDVSKASQLARVAQDAAVIGNINSSEAYERLVRGIQTGEQETLRTIGLNVSWESSYKALASQLHKNAGALTESEKIQARVNATMEAGAGIAGTYEASMTTTGKMILSMQRYWDNLKVTAGGAFLAGLAEGTKELTGALKDSEAAIQGNKEQMYSLSETIKNGVVGAIRGTKTALSLASDGWDRYGDDLIVAAGLLGAAEVAQYAFNVSVSKNPYMQAVLAIGLMNEGLRYYGMNLGSLKDKAGDFRTHFQNIADVISGKRDANSGALLSEAEQITRKIATLKSEISAANAPEKPWYLFSVFDDAKTGAENVKRLADEIAALQVQLKNADKTFFQMADGQAGYTVDIKKNYLPGYDEEGATVARQKAATAATEKAKEASKEAQRLADQWKSTKRDLEQEINLSGLTGLEQKLQEITNKATEYHIQFDKAGGKDAINTWESQMKAAAELADELGRVSKAYETQGDLVNELFDMEEQMHLAGLDKEGQAIAKIEKENQLLREKAYLLKLNKSISPEQYDAFSDTISKKQIRELDELKNKGDKTAKALDKAFTGWASNMAKDFNDMLWSAEFTFSGILESFGKMITQMIIQASVVEPMMGAFKGAGGISGIFGSLFGGFSAETSFAGAQADLSYVPSAHGNAFSGPGISAYSNSVVSSPTIFPFASGVGLMGEKPGSPGEAIMPLTRMPGGDLGVKAQGGGANVQVNVINNVSGAQATARERTDGNGGRIIDVFIEQVKGAIAGDISRGDGVIPAALGQTYGLNRVAGAY